MWQQARPSPRRTPRLENNLSRFRRSSGLEYEEHENVSAVKHTRSFEDTVNDRATPLAALRQHSKYVLCLFSKT